MSLRYLLDTNALSDIIREPDGIVALRAEKAGERTLCCSVVTACELRYGAEKRGSARLSQLVDTALSRLPVLPLAPPIDRVYASLRDRLARSGQTIGPNDLLIAAHALAEDLVLVSDHVKEFERVGGLALENWRRPGRPSNIDVDE